MKDKRNPKKKQSIRKSPKNEWRVRGVEATSMDSVLSSSLAHSRYIVDLSENRKKFREVLERLSRLLRYEQVKKKKKIIFQRSVKNGSREYPKSNDDEENITIFENIYIFFSHHAPQLLFVL